MDAADRQELIEGLCAFEGRWPGTDAERRAANWLAEQLRGMKRKVSIEATFVHPEWTLVHALIALIAVAGSLISVSVAPVGFALVLVAAAAFYLDVNTRLYIVRRLFFRRASQNVVSPGSNPGAPHRVYLTAHYDAAKTGVVFGERARRINDRIPKRLRVVAGPMRIFFWGGLVPLLLITGLRMAGADSGGLALIQLIPTANLIITIVLMLDIALSDVVPGACDNASGVAAVLSAAAALEADAPENLDVWVLLPGAEECLCEGMRSYMVRHKSELDRATTWFINVDAVSWGATSYEVSEGAVVSYGMDRRLVENCDLLAEGSSAEKIADRPIPISHPLITDAIAPAVRGYPAISILGSKDSYPPPYYHTAGDTPDRVEAEPLERAVNLTVDLVRLLDHDIGRDIEASEAEFEDSAEAEPASADRI